jgi:hypothetical protein
MIKTPTEAYPLTWPEGFPRTPANKRERARFGRKGSSFGVSRLTVNQAILRLKGEVQAFTRVGHDWRIDPELVVVSTNVRTRNDGLPYSNAREPEDSGVAVYLELDGEPHVFPCDRWDRVADNIAAIAAHLGAMRGMERWGVGDLRRVFAGFAALPPGTGESYGHVDHWWDTLGVQPDARRPEIEAAYRRLRSQHHPDRGGDPEKFDKVRRAFEQARRGWR